MLIISRAAKAGSDIESLLRAYCHLVQHLCTDIFACQEHGIRGIFHLPGSLKVGGEGVGCLVLFERNI